MEDAICVYDNYISYGLLRLKGFERLHGKIIKPLTNSRKNAYLCGV